MRKSLLEAEFTRAELRRDRRVCQAPDAVERRCDEILEALIGGAGREEVAIRTGEVSLAAVIDQAKSLELQLMDIAPRGNVDRGWAEGFVVKAYLNRWWPLGPPPPLEETVLDKSGSKSRFEPRAD